MARSLFALHFSIAIAFVLVASPSWAQEPPSTEPLVSPVPVAVPDPVAPVDPAPGTPEKTTEPTLPLGGRVFTYLRMPTSDPGRLPLQQVSASAWLEARPRFSETTWARLTLSADALAIGIDGSSGLRANVREAYVGTAKHGWELRVGQQIIPWGNADGINPVDVLGARDHTFFATDTEVSRLGAISVLGSLTPNDGTSPFTFTVVVTPVFTSSKLLPPPGAIPDAVVLRGVTRPKASAENVETAVKVAYAGKGWDVGLIGFRGYNHLPEVELVSVAPSEVVLHQVHRRNVVGGLLASWSPGKWVLRTEGAFVWSQDAKEGDPRRAPSHVHAVMGVERAFGERIRVQIQGIAKQAIDHRKPDDYVDASPMAGLTDIGRAVAQVNAVLFNYTTPLRLAGTARVAFTTEDELFSAELFALANAYGNDGLLRPLVSLRPSDPLRFSLGAEILFGRESTPLGALRRYSGAFAEARYVF